MYSDLLSLIIKELIAILGDKRSRVVVFWFGVPLRESLVTLFTGIACFLSSA